MAGRTGTGRNQHALHAIADGEARIGAVGKRGSNGRAVIEDDPKNPRRVLTVSELTLRIRTLLEERFLEVWVEGELSNCRHWNTGHLSESQRRVRSAVAAILRAD